MSGLQNPTLQLVVYRPELRWADDGSKLEDAPGNTFVKRLLELQAPQVTIKGGGESAYFGALVADLPEPAILDAESGLLRELKLHARKLSAGFTSPVAKDVEG